MSLTLRCDMEETCTAPVTHIDEKGFVYCAPHGIQRREYGRRCRKLTERERRVLWSGHAIWYDTKRNQIERCACGHTKVVGA